MPEDLAADICTDDAWPKDANEDPISPCPKPGAEISTNPPSIDAFFNADGTLDLINYPFIARPTFGGNLEDWYTKFNDDEIRGATPPHEVRWDSRNNFAVYSNRYC